MSKLISARSLEEIFRSNRAEGAPPEVDAERFRRVFAGCSHRRPVNPAVARVYIRERQMPEEARFLEVLDQAAKFHDLEIRGFHFDIGKSGMSLMGLPALVSLLELCREGEVGIVVVRDTARLGRGGGYLPVVDLLRKLQIRLLDLSCGEFVDLDPRATLLTSSVGRARRSVWFSSKTAASRQPS